MSEKTCKDCQFFQYCERASDHEEQCPAADALKEITAAITAADEHVPNEKYLNDAMLVISGVMDAVTEFINNTAKFLTTVEGAIGTRFIGNPDDPFSRVERDGKTLWSILIRLENCIKEAKQILEPTNGSDK